MLFSIVWLVCKENLPVFTLLLTMSAKQSFQKLESLPHYWNEYMPKPLIYPENSNSIIISTSSHDVNAGIFKYDLITNTMENLCKYDDSIGCIAHGQFIDCDFLFIFGGENDLFFVFDLKINSNITQKYVDNVLHDIHNCGVDPNSVRISSNKMNKIHILTQDHIIYDSNFKTLTKIDTNILDKEEILFPKVIYNEWSEQLIILGSDDNDCILTCKINTKSNENEYKWEVNKKIKMPYIAGDVRDYSAVTFGDIIIVFYCGYCRCFDIWCLDLLFYKWFKSEHSIPKSVNEASCIENNNDIHILDFEHSDHFKINIYELFTN
eukprot:395467_1